MSVQHSQIIAGSWFVTATNQLRKVIEVKHQANGTIRVVYEAKSIETPNQKFVRAATITNPPLIETFCDACERELSNAEVADLRKNNIILAGE
jgi:hypothetical protein